MAFTFETIIKMVKILNLSITFRNVCSCFCNQPIPSQSSFVSLPFTNNHEFIFSLPGKPLFFFQDFMKLIQQVCIQFCLISFSQHNYFEIDSFGFLLSSSLLKVKDRHIRSMLLKIRHKTQQEVTGKRSFVGRHLES